MEVSSKVIFPVVYLTISPQVSAYSSFAIKGVGIGLDKQRKRLDPSTNEPLFTNCTRDFIGTLDYIFYTGILGLPTAVHFIELGCSPPL